MQTDQSSQPREIGQMAEQFVLRELQQHGLRLVAQNYYSRLGELDLIMLDHDCLVFVEVKYRSRQDYGGALGSITQRKKKRIIAAARHYLAKLHHEPCCRFDVVEVTDKADGGLNANWIKSAFDT